MSTKYLLKELAIAEDEIAKVAPNSGLRATVMELPSVAGNELRIHVEFAMRRNISHGAGEDEVRRATKELVNGFRGYIERYAQTLDAEAAVLR